MTGHLGDILVVLLVVVVGVGYRGRHSRRTEKVKAASPPSLGAAYAVNTPVPFLCCETGREPLSSSTYCYRYYFLVYYYYYSTGR